MQRGDFPLPLHLHPVRQLLVHVAKLISRRAETGRTTRFIMVRAHRGEPLNELADTLASEAAESDPPPSQTQCVLSRLTRTQRAPSAPASAGGTDRDLAATQFTKKTASHTIL
jgi:hypothetical protein